MPKKPDFGKITKNSLKRPKSMDDFLSSEPSEDKKPQKKSSEPEHKELKSSKIKTPTDVNKEPEDIIRFEQTTIYAEPYIFDILDSLWIKFRRKAPSGSKKRISKSLIVKKMISYCNDEIEKKGFDSKIAKKILEE